VALNPFIWDRPLDDPSKILGMTRSLRTHAWLRSPCRRPTLTGLAVAAGLLWFAIPSVAAGVVGMWSRSAPITPATGVAATDEAVCASSRLCFADDGSGDITALAQPASAARSEQLVASLAGELDVETASLQCPTTTFCAAVGGFYGDNGYDAPQLFVSTTPSAGATSWRSYDLTEGLTQLACPSASFCAGVTADGRLATSTDPARGSSAWTPTTLGAALKLVDCPSSSVCLALDQSGRVWTSTDPTGGAGAWGQSGAPALHVASGGGAGGGAVLACAGVSVCVAAASTPGDVLVSGDPLGAGTWTQIDVAGSTPVKAVTCETDRGTPLCLAGDTTGGIATSTDPAAGASSWALVSADADRRIRTLSCSGPTCVAADGAHTALVATVPDASSWHWMPISESDRDSLVAVSCPTTTECIAPNSSVYFSSSDPAGSARSWRGRRQTDQFGDGDGDTLDSSCASPTLCLAVVVDQGLYDTSGGDLFTYDPVGGAHGFREVSAVIDPLYVACAQRTCVSGGGGDWFQTADPGRAASWKRVAHPRFDVTCLPRRGCVGLPDGPFLGTAGPDLATAAGARGPWRLTAIDPGQEITGLACPSANRCVAVDQTGHVLTSTDPTGGAGAWRVVDVDPNGLVSLSCPSVALCVAVDGNSSVLVVAQRREKGR